MPRPLIQCRIDEDKMTAIKKNWSGPSVFLDEAIDGLLSKKGLLPGAKKAAVRKVAAPPRKKAVAKVAPSRREVTPLPKPGKK